MKLSTLYRRAARMLVEHRAHYACTAIYALKRGMHELHHPPAVFFQTFDIEALAFTQAFTNPKYRNDTQFRGVFGHASNPDNREQRVIALCLFADILDSQGEL